ncbi:Uncharacterised protein [Klebsiella grimontii]|uniref:Uncharacterized protein n=1 Tax=Klebsiella grimontii TaxID=2058152 RepID=A0A7H4P5A8_9ENTR|nr:Uncharacterised protein [Klebsiella grimontii]
MQTISFKNHNPVMGLPTELRKISFPVYAGHG